jgi:hypothetical protein
MPTVNSELLTSANYALLSYGGITNTGNTTVTGGVIGAFPTASYTGWNPPGIATIDSAHAQQARIDGNAAFLYYQGLSATQAITTADLGTQSGGGAPTGHYFAGVYVSPSSIAISTPIVLDAQGNTNALFVFYSTASTVTQAIAGTISLAGGANANNVIWVVGSSWTSIGPGAVTVGNILAYASVTLGGGTLLGRALAVGGGNGAITIAAAETITVPSSSNVPGLYNVLGCVGLPNIQVELVPVRMVTGGSVNTQLLFTTSDALGNYAFQSVAPGSYQITAVDPTGVHVYRNRVAATVVNADLTDLNPVPALLNALYGSSRGQNVANSPLS